MHYYLHLLKSELFSNYLPLHKMLLKVSLLGSINFCLRDHDYNVCLYCKPSVYKSSDPFFENSVGGYIYMFGGGGGGDVLYW